MLFIVVSLLAWLKPENKYGSTAEYDSDLSHYVRIVAYRPQRIFITNLLGPEIVDWSFWIVFFVGWDNYLLHLDLVLLNQLVWFISRLLLALRHLVQSLPKILTVTLDLDELLLQLKLLGLKLLYTRLSCFQLWA